MVNIHSQFHIHSRKTTSFTLLQVVCFTSLHSFPIHSRHVANSFHMLPLHSTASQFIPDMLPIHSTASQFIPDMLPIHSIQLLGTNQQHVGNLIDQSPVIIPEKPVPNYHCKSSFLRNWNTWPIPVPSRYVWQRHWLQYVGELQSLQWWPILWHCGTGCTDRPMSPWILLPAICQGVNTQSDHGCQHLSSRWVKEYFKFSFFFCIEYPKCWKTVQNNPTFFIWGTSQMITLKSNGCVLHL
jgi:hypothetical protein